MTTLQRTRWALVLACLTAILLAACAPAALPTATPAPTAVPPTDVPTEEATVVDVETEAPELTEPAADRTDEPGDGDGSEATDEPGAEGTGEASASGTAQMGTVSVSTTRVRSAPTLTGDVVAELTFGDRITAIAQNQNGGYVYIQAEGGVEGWIAKQTVQFDARFFELPVRSS